MITVNPNNTEHDIDITPRYFPANEIILHIVNSFDGSDDIIDVTYVRTEEDQLRLSFTYTFTDEETYKVSLSNNAEDFIYRGMILSTTQESQKRTLTKFKYIWK